MSELTIFMQGGVEFASGPGGVVKRLDEFCLSLRAPETGVFVKDVDCIVFADGSSLNKKGGGSYPPAPNRNYPAGRAERLIWLYWGTRFNRPSLAFSQLKVNLDERGKAGGAPTQDDIDELKRLKRIIESTAKEVGKAETALKKTQPNFRIRTEADATMDARIEQHKQRMRNAANKIELNV